MTPTTMPEDLLKSDVLGRVRTPGGRREALLDEFERSGLTGQKFAGLVGVKYQTFASWVQKRRRARGGYPKLKAPPEAAKESKPVQWLEAVSEAGSREPSGLRIELPGGVWMKITHAEQAALAGRLLRELLGTKEAC